MSCATSCGDPFGLLTGFDLASLSLSGPDLSGSGDPTYTVVEAPAGLYLDDCSVCGGQMRRGANDLENVCVECGLVVEGDTTEYDGDDTVRMPSSSARLRIVGSNSSCLQPDLYRSGGGNTPISQQKQIFEEFKVYRNLYIEAGGRAYPLNACEKAAEYYSEVQRACVKRSQSKKVIMAFCLQRACHSIGFAPGKADISMMMQLPGKGIARGENFVRSLIADGKMELEANPDQCRPEISTLFVHLGYGVARYERLREAAYQIVQLALTKNIGTNSVLRSKAAGATFIVLSRCDRALLPSPDLKEFCKKNQIRKNTVERFTKQVEDYHSHFVPLFEEFGLSTAVASDS